MSVKNAIIKLICDSGGALTVLLIIISIVIQGWRVADTRDAEFHQCCRMWSNCKESDFPRDPTPGILLILSVVVSSITAICIVLKSTNIDQGAAWMGLVIGICSCTAAAIVWFVEISVLHNCAGLITSLVLTIAGVVLIVSTAFCTIIL